MSHRLLCILLVRMVLLPILLVNAVQEEQGSDSDSEPEDATVTDTAADVGDIDEASGYARGVSSGLAMTHSPDRHTPPRPTMMQPSIPRPLGSHGGQPPEVQAYNSSAGHMQGMDMGPLHGNLPSPMPHSSSLP